MAQVKTKFESGEKVWTLNGGKAFEFEIGKITVTMEEDSSVSVSYCEKGNPYLASFPESMCFASLDELKEYIFG